MNDNFRQQIDQLLNQAFQLGPGAAKITLLEEAVRLADLHGDLDDGFSIRQDLIDACTFGGRPDISLVAFSWCLAQCDRNPGRFYQDDLLWKYKWIAHSLPAFPQISKKQIEDTLEDLERRFQTVGSTQPVTLLRQKIALRMGDRQTASAAQRILNRKGRDWLSDCRACELDHQIHYLIFRGKYRQALEKAEPILRGVYSCAEVPHITYAQLLVPLLRLNLPALGMEYHLKGFRLIARQPDGFVPEIAEHIIFLALTDNLTRAKNVFEKNFGHALATDPRSRFFFFKAGRVLLDRLKDQGLETRKLNLPPLPASPFEVSAPTIAEFLPWLNGQLENLASQFDNRNGNHYHQTILKKLGQMKKLAQPFPVPTRRTQKAQGQ